MKIAIEGCAHGELEKIYDTLDIIQEENNIKIDLLICCGDFQSSRNESDLMCMAVPPKYQDICTFYKYYSGEKVAPVLTIFIGGNHEASNYLQELPYGGWVAPNIYYLGYAGVINVAGVRIAGLSGIYKSRDYTKGHFEKPPYDENSKRSVYHVRNLEVFRLKQISGKIDIFLSHDWPSEVFKYGNVQQLLKRKPHFREDVDKNELGSKVCQDLLVHLKPEYWFSAHLHCKYAALVRHEDDTVTKFLALDKCLPKRKFLQVVDIENDGDSKIEINYDLEWLTVLYLTNHLLWVKNSHTYMPGPGLKERFDFTPTKEEMSHVSARFDGDLVVPNNFTKTAPAYDPTTSKKKNAIQPEPTLNPQTVLFCEKLAVDDPVSQASDLEGISLNVSEDYGNSTASFIDDTIDVSELDTSNNPPSKKRPNMNLPEPKAGSNNESSSDSSNEQEEAEANLFGPCDISPIKKSAARSTAVGDSSVDESALLNESALSSESVLIDESASKSALIDESALSSESVLIDESALIDESGLSSESVSIDESAVVDEAVSQESSRVTASSSESSTDVDSVVGPGEIIHEESLGVDAESSSESVKESVSSESVGDSEIQVKVDDEELVVETVESAGLSEASTGSKDEEASSSSQSVDESRVKGVSDDESLKVDESPTKKLSNDCETLSLDADSASSNRSDVHSSEKDEPLKVCHPSPDSTVEVGDTSVGSLVESRVGRASPDESAIVDDVAVKVDESAVSCDSAKVDASIAVPLKVDESAVSCDSAKVDASIAVPLKVGLSDSAKVGKISLVESVEAANTSTGSAVSDDSSAIEETVKAVEEGAIAKCEDPAPPKKFKRRNTSMYRSDGT